MFSPTFDHELSLWNQGFNTVVGVDEAGRGAWAGPLVAAAVTFPPFFFNSKNKKSRFLLENVRDSKLLVAKRREELSEFVKKEAGDFGFGVVSQKSIDRIGIVSATQKAMRQAIRGLKGENSFYLIDAFHIRYIKKSFQEAIVSGDKLCFSIASASILAKVYRDQLMEELDEKYPVYGFRKHKGYGTREHQEALRVNGISRIHRRSYRPIMDLNIKN